MVNQWIKRYCPRRYPKIRLFCLPPAGGGASTFRRWGYLLPNEIEVCAVQLPGRESRLTESPLRHFDDLLQAIKQSLTPYLEYPFALFGHSMGALLAFSLACEFQQDLGLHPTYLFVSAHEAPQLLLTQSAKEEEIDDITLAKEFCALAGISEEIIRSEDLIDLLIATIRADFSICKSFKYIPVELLTCPIAALGGLEDSIPREAMEAWSKQTSGKFKLHMFPGAHHYIRQCEEPLLQIIARDLLEELTST